MLRLPDDALDAAGHPDRTPPKPPKAPDAAEAYLAWRRYADGGNLLGTSDTAARAIADEVDALLVARYVKQRSWQEDLVNLFFCQAQTAAEGGLNLACCSLDNKDATMANTFVCDRSASFLFLGGGVSHVWLPRAARRRASRCLRVLRSLLTPPSLLRA